MNKPETTDQSALRLWDRVAIILEKDGNKSEFVTRVEDIRRDCYVFEMPIRHGGGLRLQKGDAVEVMYNRHDAVYSFKASILDLFEDDDGTVKVARTSETTRNQRRRYVRLDISGKMTFRALAEEGTDPIGVETTGRLLNISAGGILFESPLLLRQNGLIIVSLALRAHQNIENILTMVKRCEGSKGRGYLVGAEFITKHNLADYGLEHIEQYLPPGTGTFDENLQRLVIQFIYDQQVELRKRDTLKK